VRRWNSPSVNIIHGTMALVNVGLGLFNFALHHYLAGSFGFSAAIAIALINIWCAKMNRRRQQLEQERHRINHIVEEMKLMTLDEQMKALGLARENLKRVAASMGAKIGRDYDQAFVKIGHYKYDVRRDMIYRQHEHAIDSTCLQIPPMPYPERIASVLLLLRNDPTIFDRWAKHDKYYA